MAVFLINTVLVYTINAANDCTGENLQKPNDQPRTEEESLSCPGREHPGAVISCLVRILASPTDAEQEMRMLKFVPSISSARETTCGPYVDCALIKNGYATRYLNAMNILRHQCSAGEVRNLRDGEITEVRTHRSATDAKAEFVLQDGYATKDEMETSKREIEAMKRELNDAMNLRDNYATKEEMSKLSREIKEERGEQDRAMNTFRQGMDERISRDWKAYSDTFQMELARHGHTLTSEVISRIACNVPLPVDSTEGDTDQAIVDIALEVEAMMKDHRDATREEIDGLREAMETKMHLLIEERDVLQREVYRQEGQQWQAVACGLASGIAVILIILIIIMSAKLAQARKKQDQDIRP